MSYFKRNTIMREAKYSTILEELLFLSKYRIEKGNFTMSDELSQSENIAPMLTISEFLNFKNETNPSHDCEHK